MELIEKYFPDLTESQRARFAALYDLYADWNAKINVVFAQGFRPALPAARAALAGHCEGLPVRRRGADPGCGLRGGFPSVPLAILFPEAYFTAADSIRKKITVVEGGLAEPRVL